MKSISRTVVGLLSLLAPLVGAQGCAVESEAAEQASESEIVGTTDLSKLEAAFGLVKDVQSNGVWMRGEITLKAGACYKEKLGAGAKDPQNWEFRRYMNGAAFFRKANTGAASGNKRPIACVDLDTEQAPMHLDGFALDTALRYKMGKPLGPEGAAGHLYLSFENSDLELRDASHLCGLFADATDSIYKGFYPGLRAYADELKTCKASGKSDAACETSADNACKWWSTVDMRADTLDRPSWGDTYVSGFVGANNPLLALAPEQMMLAYKYAFAKGVQSDIFSIGDDPIGAFKTVESGELKGASSWVVARYEHLDVHRVINGSDEGLYITPKSSDKKIEGSAIVSCHKDVTVATSAFVCNGL